MKLYRIVEWGYPGDHFESYPPGDEEFRLYANRETAQRRCDEHNEALRVRLNADAQEAHRTRVARERERHQHLQARIAAGVTPRGDVPNEYTPPPDPDPIDVGPRTSGWWSVDDETVEVVED